MDEHHQLAVSYQVDSDESSLRVSNSAPPLSDQPGTKNLQDVRSAAPVQPSCSGAVLQDEQLQPSNLQPCGEVVLNSPHYTTQPRAHPLESAAERGMGQHRPLRVYGRRNVANVQEDKDDYVLQNRTGSSGSFTHDNERALAEELIQVHILFLV